MKKYFFAFAAAAAMLGITAWIVVAYSVWYANTKPIVHTPSAVEQGRTALHTQLAASMQREASIEKLYWDSPSKLQILIDAHKQRIDKVQSNPAGGEIVSHDQDAIAKLGKRISDLYVQQKAREAAAEAAAERAAEEGDADANATPAATAPQQ
jgi:hypothetical protein